MPLVEVIKRHPRGLLVAMGARIGTDVAFYTFTLYILTFITTNLGLPRQVGLNAVLIGSAVPAGADPAVRGAVRPLRAAPGLRRSAR